MPCTTRFSFHSLPFLNVRIRHSDTAIAEPLDETGSLILESAESRQRKKDGNKEVLKSSRWCLLKRRANLTTKQTVKLREP